jgi:hypothetical protein
VVRIFAGGFAIKFVEKRSLDELNRLIVRAEPRSASPISANLKSANPRPAYPVSAAPVLLAIGDP